MARLHLGLDALGTEASVLDDLNAGLLGEGLTAPHRHRVQEQVYHVLSGEGLMEMDGKRQVVRAHDVIFIPPGVEHALCNTGLVPLTFIVVTAPVSDDGPLD